MPVLFALLSPLSLVPVVHTYFKSVRDVDARNSCSSESIHPVYDSERAAISYFGTVFV